ncbi:hypothetical protein IW261DRAFT_1397919 [Armillaria novae-zelandiae]|uniref:protein-tyrosine-phosphatase n=1 Tax=Armillaria novae-zelandiae TaxID=153914 RepID=A0AA39PDP3_9AGAR|nr:hypothetical protein IW261DRAFT_1397910 [Armillaria novae-zelandiae]KAK0481920.1 hypothetical protein IW261DRAFT_1397912 [Armillaria novae-zelandiae]KAK0481925.1 hypothetical protein IW261DRAFT_1397914 [Armillaria novae-zelandiae]KAK0481930.1 hypothetical protein IW261DRAFT_1397919 [Armillaria novae-zelandiae]
MHTSGTSQGRILLEGGAVVRAENWFSFFNASSVGRNSSPNPTGGGCSGVRAGREWGASSAHSIFRVRRHSCIRVDCPRTGRPRLPPPRTMRAIMQSSTLPCRSCRCLARRLSFFSFCCFFCPRWACETMAADPPRKRGPPPDLRIHTPTLSSRNTNKLSLTLPDPRDSSAPLPPRPRRPSVISLPAPTPAALLARSEEHDLDVSYADGPLQIIPGIWLGSEDNTRDWPRLCKRGIKIVLNVTKEIASPFDASQPLRSFASAPDLKSPRPDTFYPAHHASGCPAMHYLKLMWSHGQQDLVTTGFPAAMAFTDAAFNRGDGVLIHCECGVSCSATMIIALVMRAAAEHSPAVPPEIWALKGMQPAYDFVKQKSKWIGPTMYLIYQLLDYERKLTGFLSNSECSSIVDEEEEWGRRRRLLDEAPEDEENTSVMQEAKALDKAMEDRIVARKSSASSTSSMASSTSGVGMGTAWRSRYGARKRTGSVPSSIFSEDLVEEDEERSLLGVGGGFDETSSFEHETLSSSTNSPDDVDYRRSTASQLPRPAPTWKTSFNFAPPPSATRTTFDITPKVKRWPVPLLQPVPPSPTNAVSPKAPKHHPSPSTSPSPRPHKLSLRMRTESRKPAPPPLHLRHSVLNQARPQTSHASTPSQTLFVFPPSPTMGRTPATMTLTNEGVPWPAITPRVSTFRSHGRTRSFIGIAAPPTPTTAFSKVDARGYVGLESSML